MNMKPARKSDGAPTPRKNLSGSSRSAIYANRSSKPVLCTHTHQVQELLKKLTAGGAKHRTQELST